MKRMKIGLSIVLSILLSFSAVFSGGGVVVAATENEAIQVSESGTRLSGKRNTEAIVDVVLYNVDGSGNISGASIIDAEKTETNETDEEGNFTIFIKKQPLNSKVSVIFKDKTTGEILLKEIVTISTTTDSTAPSSGGDAPKITKVSVTNGAALYDTGKIISGIVDKSSEITAYVGNKEVGTATAKKNINGNYEFIIILEKSLEVGAIVTLQTVDGHDAVNIEVQEDNRPLELLTDMVIIGDGKVDTVFSGQLNREGTVEVFKYMADKPTLKQTVVLPVDTDKNGNFSVTIPKQLKGTKLLIVFIDKQGNRKENLITVQDTTKPAFESISNVKNTDRTITGTVSEDATITATNGNIVVGTAKAQLRKNGSKFEYVFTIVLPKAQTTGTVITLQAKDMAKPILESNIVNAVVVDNPDFEPKLSEILVIKDTTTSVQGKVDRSANVQLFVDKVALNTNPVTTDAYGNFKIPIKKQKVDTNITIKMIDAAFNEGTATVKVTDGTPPVIEKVDSIYNSSEYITGKLSEPGTVTIEELKGTDDKVLSFKTNPDGTFTYKLTSTLTPKTKLTFTAVDDAELKNQTEKEKVMIVKEDKTAPKLVSPKKLEISNKDISVSGQINEKGKVKLLNSKGELVGSIAITENDGTFTLTFPKQQAKTKLTLVLVDNVGNEKKSTITVTDRTLPELTVDKPTIMNTTKVITGTVSEPATVTAYSGSSVIGKISVKSQDNNGKYSFTLTLKNYPVAGSAITLKAVDSAKNESENKTITVTGAAISSYKFDPEDTELKITNNQTKVTGKLNQPGIVQLQSVKGVLLHKKPVETDEDGNFTITIKKQEAGTEIEFVVRTLTGDITNFKKTIKVEDIIPPKIKKVEAIYETSNFIEGQVSEQATIKVSKFVNGKWEDVKFLIVDGTNIDPETQKPKMKEISDGETDPSGYFKLHLKEKLPVNASIKVIAVDEGDVAAEQEKLLTVKADNKAPKLVTPKKLAVSAYLDTTIDGQLSEEGTVDVLVNGKSILVGGKTPTDINGIFSIKIPKQLPKTKLEFVFTDMKKLAPNSSTKKVTVK